MYNLMQRIMMERYPQRLPKHTHAVLRERARQIGISTSSLSGRLIIIPVAAVAANRDLIILSPLIVSLPETKRRL